MLKGFLFDGQFKPIINGNMVVDAQWNDQKFEIETTSDSSGTFLVPFNPPGEGHFTLTATGFKNGTKLGEDSFEFEIIPMEKEFLRTTQNDDFLRRIAELGNGRYFDVSRLDSVLPSLDLRNNVLINQKLIEVWYQPLLLGLIILLATVEWIMRKRLGLV